MTFGLVEKGEEDIILKLYRSVLDTPHCRWSTDYPAVENIEDDMAREGLFCLRDKGEIIGAISIDLDEDVENLPCWRKELQPSFELSRLCVRKDYQGQGLPGKMIEHMMEYGKECGYKSVHYLVSKNNPVAQKAYSKLGFDLVGQCALYHDEYFCYEKAL